MNAVDSKIEQAVSEYAESRPKYNRFAEKVCELITKYCPNEHIHTTESRAKEIDSFRRKCSKLDGEKLRYDKPFDQITDLSGVRVIVFVRESVDVICEKIGDIFDVREVEDVGERVYLQGKFGYQSKHLLVKMGSERTNLFDYKEFKDMICEIQVRTILQHAWAEMEHDIQYKSDEEIPLDLKKRFSALAGLLELADREFQNIQRDSEALKRSVRDELITALTQQTLAEATAEHGLDHQGRQTVAARDLINKGKYAEAVEIYSEKIADQPNSYTLFLGRSKARFLAGDITGAIIDMDKADLLSGTSDYTARLRSIMENGEDPRRALKSENQIIMGDRINEALELLKEGEGIAAFEAYTSLADNGRIALSAFGRAMSCCLELDTKGAQTFLGTLECRAATAMAVNIWALRAIINIIDKQDPNECIKELKRALSEMPTYSFEVGPLATFYQGFRRKQSEDLISETKQIFDLLIETDSRAPH